MSNYDESYMGKIRKLIGKQTFIVTAARGILRDPEGRILFIRRRDNDLWGLPAGSQELDESISDCLIREVKEETGLEVVSATPMAIYSCIQATSAYGDPYQLFIVQFVVDEWSGELIRETDETVDARFFSLDALPEEIPDSYHEMISDLKEYDRKLILK